MLSGTFKLIEPVVKISDKFDPKFIKVIDFLKGSAKSVAPLSSKVHQLLKFNDVTSPKSLNNSEHSPVPLFLQVNLYCSFLLRY